MLKIEEGKFYKTRDGRKVGPMSLWMDSSMYHQGDHCDDLWHEDGQNNDPIISEWPSEDTGPIRTITRREIVPGVYGIVEIESDGYISINGNKYTPDELREAAHLFNLLAEYLESEGK